MKIDIKFWKNLWGSWFLLLISIYFGIHIVYAQEPDSPSRFLTVNDGLPQGYVSGIVQDNEGFIWAGTLNGLARYDGKNFKVYYHNPKDTQSLAGNIIKTIFLDSRNRIWICIEDQGVDVFYPETEKIVHLGKQRGFEVLKTMKLPAHAIYEDAENNIWFNTVSNGFLQMNIDKGYLKTPLVNIVPKGERVLGFTQSPKGHYYLLTQKMLYELDKKQEFVKQAGFAVPPFFITPGENTYGLLFPDDTTLLIAGMAGIARFLLNEDRFEVISKAPALTQWCFNKDSLMYCNFETGTYAYSYASNSYKVITNVVANSTSIIDKTNMLWVGTSGYGIQLANLQPGSFRSQKYDLPFPEFVLKELLTVEPGNIPRSFTNGDIYGLRWAYDKTGRLWIANQRSKNNSSLDVFVYENKKLNKPAWHYADGKKINTGIIFGISADSKNNIWVLSSGYVLHKSDPLSAVIQTFTPALPHSLPGENMESLWIDAEDNVWISCGYGLLLYRPGAAGYILYSINPDDIFNLSANRVINIAGDLHDKDKLWMGTLGNGLLCFNKKEKKFIPFTKREGLPDNTIYSVMADDNGYLWCSTNHGIFRFDTRTNKARKYASTNGAADFEFNRFHHFRAPDGRFVFAGFSDYAIFDPQSLKEDESQPNIAIVSWKINNKASDHGEEGSTLRQPVNSLSTVYLDYDQNFITLEFAALQFNQPELFEYRHKLSGIDKEWVYTGTNNMVNYTDLSPGTYTLSLNATNSTGKWSDKFKELRIVIMPPWWKTVWFYAIMIIAAISLVYAIYRYRLNQLLKVERIRNRIARDLHDEIGSSLSTISIYSKVVQQQLKRTGDNSEPLLAKISENAHQAQDAMSDIVWSINARNDELESIINRMREHAVQLCEAKGYSLHFEFDEQLHAIKIDMERRKDFYLIYKEALNNAVKYAGGKNIWISLTSDKEHITLSVKDDGKGFDVSDSFKNGNGLHNMQSRAGAIKGTIRVVSEKGKGTILHLTIPK